MTSTVILIFGRLEKDKRPR